MTCLLSASMIVKNETRLIAGCLDSLQDFVDEIVIYDTGSQDRTVEIARAWRGRGANRVYLVPTVIEGEWHDNFADARNASLAACHGRYVLRVDADEVVAGNPANLRYVLTKATEPIYAHTLTSDAGQALLAGHIFDPTEFRWAGAVYEVLWPRVPSDRQAERRVSVLPSCTFAVSRRRGSKSAGSLERDLRYAVKAVDAGEVDPFDG